MNRAFNNRKSLKQEKIFLQRMKENPDMAWGLPKEKKKEYDAFWVNLVAELNDNGPPIKHMTEWKKTWSDWRSYVRKKLAQNGTKAVRMTDAEIQVANILKLIKTPEISSEGTETFLSNIFLADDDSDDSRSSDSNKCSSSKRKCEATSSREDQNDSLLNDTKRKREATPSQEEQQNDTLISETKRDTTSLENDNDTLLSDTSIQEDLRGFPLPETTFPRFYRGTSDSTSKLENRVARCFKRIYNTLEDIYKIQKETNKENERHHRVMEELLREKNMIKMRSLELQELKYKFELEQKLSNGNHVNDTTE
ncbi:uncharacterized protein LOC133334468 [Musca vetustissima]|uniref:uncharacterized protein LOC133334468 n=1 Tax=Musca vetustissima TaxID=27455 RepID=UPI002AB74160|nr:uncharacterized protein LOC133334468 [Musca vetustissima]